MEYLIRKKAPWEEIPEEEIQVRGRAFNPDVKAFFKICYDDEAIYVNLRAIEKDIRAEFTDNFGMPCEDSCMEFFFSPDNSQKKYFNIEMNPNCAMYLGIGLNGSNLIRLNPQGKRYSFAPESVRTEDGWQLTYKVPYEFIRFFFPEFKPVSGGYIMANVYKCGDLTVKEHYLSWKPVDWDVKNGAFHNPDCFGVMRFE